MSEKNIENITKSDSNFAPIFVDHHLLPNINFHGHCLIKNNISIPKKIINLYISYTPNPQSRNLNTDFTLGNCLFGSVKLDVNADLDKYKYTGYDIIFGADVSSFVHIDNKGNHILIFGEGPTQGLDDTTLTAEAIYPINFTQPNKRSALSLHYNGSNSFLFVNDTKIFQFKAKNSEIKDYPLYLVNI